VKLWWAARLCILVGLVLGLNAWLIFRPCPAQKTVADSWSPWAMVLLPAEEQLEPELQRLYLQRLRAVPDENDFDKPQRLLGDCGRARGVRVVDLLPLFRSKAGGRRLYIPNDVHWNREGHALAAEAVLRELGPVFGEIDRLATVVVTGDGVARAPGGR
jgi:hypothetical protein